MRLRSLTMVIAVTGSVLAVGAPAGSVTSSFRASCVTTGIHGPVTTTRSIGTTVHAPDSVVPGATFSVPITIGYSVPTVTGTVGAAIFSVTGATPVAPAISGPAGALELSGSLRLIAPATTGAIVTIGLDKVGAFVQIGGFLASEVCQPLAPVVMARVAVGVPQVSIGDAALVEGASGTRVLDVPVLLSRPSATDVTVGFATEDGTATAGADYVAGSGSVTIPAGSVSANVAVSVHGDAAVEAKENFRIRVHDPVGAVLGRAVGTGRIIDDDPEAGPRLSVGDVSVVEGARGTRAARFTVSLSAPATAPVSVLATTVAGSALAGSDYRIANVALAFARGETSKTVAVGVVPDAGAEETEAFTLHLSGVQGAVVGRYNGVGTIIDDD